MTARSFADTNVVVYTLDADTNKRHAAISVMRAHPVISVQVINEFLSVATGKMKLPRTTANRLAQILMKRCEVFKSMGSDSIDCFLRRLHDKNEKR